MNLNHFWPVIHVTDEGAVELVVGVEVGEGEAWSRDVEVEVEHGDDEMVE
jgi:hypothetical protein